MGIMLKKGQKIDLTKGNKSLKKLLVGLGWDTNKYDGGFDFDLDASVFMVGANGKCPTEKEERKEFQVIEQWHEEFSFFWS